MDERLIEVRQFSGSGYQPVIDFNTWRVAILNYIDEIHPERIETMERHNETDEVFVLIAGRGILFLGEGKSRPRKIHSLVLEPETIYDVKRNTWHAIVLNRSGSVLIVENRNTSRENSDYSLLDTKVREKIIKTTQRELEDLK
jgi:ureidoglycolate hydrolase